METSWAFLLPYFSLYCRAILCLAFLFSFLGKARHIPTFSRTITTFDVLPTRYSRILAVLFLGAEGATVVLILLGGGLSQLGLALGAGLLLIFSLAIASVLVRRVDTSCNCFGVSDEQISAHHIWRNTFLFACSIVALTLSFTNHAAPATLNPADWLLISMSAIISLAVVTNLQQIIRIVQPN
ncbi:MAG: hypothetical protein M3441_07275 [Chloroflexota bacterium]|nr:hypothetical protein [Chloroflexota bacterium]